MLVSDIPGTTRDSVEIPIRYYGETIYIVDTAGLRRPSRVSSPLEAYSITRVVEAVEAATVVVLLMDATEPATHQDLKIFRVVLNRLKGVVVALNKWDLVKDMSPTEQNNIRQYTISRLAPFTDVPLVTISALEGKRVFRLLEEAWKTGKRYFQRIGTGQLNRFIHSVVEETPPPYYQGKPIKFKYVVQAGVGPPQFVFFVSAPEGIRVQYVRFLERKIREKWEWSGVPFKMIFRVWGEEGDEGGPRRKEFTTGR